MLNKIELPFPDWDLSPNARKNRKFMGRKRKQLFSSWYYLTKESGIKPPNGNIPLSLIFYPPNLSMDSDNILSACKKGLDGIALAWGVDDKHFTPLLIHKAGKCAPHGRVDLYVDNVHMVYKMIIERS